MSFAPHCEANTSRLRVPDYLVLTACSEPIGKGTSGPENAIGNVSYVMVMMYFQKHVTPVPPRCFGRQPRKFLKDDHRLAAIQTFKLR